MPVHHTDAVWPAQHGAVGLGDPGQFRFQVGPRFAHLPKAGREHDHGRHTPLSTCAKGLVGQLRTDCDHREIGSLRECRDGRITGSSINVGAPRIDRVEGSLESALRRERNRSPSRAVQVRNGSDDRHGPWRQQRREIRKIAGAHAGISFVRDGLENARMESESIRWAGARTGPQAGSGSQEPAQRRMALHTLVIGNRLLQGSLFPD